MKILFLAIVASVITASCKKGFTKKHEARFKVNGTEYNVGEDGVSAGYFSGSAQFQLPQQRAVGKHFPPHL